MSAGAKRHEVVSRATSTCSDVDIVKRDRWAYCVYTYMLLQTHLEFRAWRTLASYSNALVPKAVRSNKKRNVLFLYYYFLIRGWGIVFLSVVSRFTGYYIQSLANSTLLDFSTICTIPGNEILLLREWWIGGNSSSCDDRITVVTNNEEKDSMFR